MLSLDLFNIFIYIILSHETKILNVVMKLINTIFILKKKLKKNYLKWDSSTGHCFKSLEIY